jgi:four helix bundle protein
MSALDHVQSFRDLLVYQKSRKLSKEIFQLTKTFPKEEMYSLTDQVRRSSRSVGAQIAEAWAKRRYEKHFVSKLTDSDGEQQETQHWIGVAFDCGYITENQGRELIEKCQEIGRMLAGMISKADLFCGELPQSLREESAEYFIDSDN